MRISRSVSLIGLPDILPATFAPLLYQVAIKNLCIDGTHRAANQLRADQEGERAELLSTIGAKDMADENQTQGFDTDSAVSVGTTHDWMFDDSQSHTRIQLIPHRS